MGPGADDTAEPADAVEARLYDLIGNELDAQDIDKGVWTKSFAEAMGDEAKTRAIYIRLRFRKLLDAETARYEADARNRIQEQQRLAEEECSVTRERLAESPIAAKDPQPKAKVTLPTLPDDAENKERDAQYRAAIGPKNTEFYLRYFAKRDLGGRPASWNWPAFFVPFFWAMYRKLWGVASMYAGVTFLGGIIGIVIDKSPLGTVDAVRLLSTLGGVAMIFFWPVSANAFYYGKAQRLIAVAKERNNESGGRLAYISARGGTSLVWLVLGIVFGGFLFIGLLAAVAIPSYLGYVTRSKVSEAIVVVRPIQDAVERNVAQTGFLPDAINPGIIQRIPDTQYLDAIEFAPERGLTLTFSAAAGEGVKGKSILLTAYRATLDLNSGLVWQCQNIDTPVRFLPVACRGH